MHSPAPSSQAKAPTRRVAHASVVDSLRARGLLTAPQFQAGKQFWHDFTLGLADHGGVGRYSPEAPIPRHHAEGRLIGTEARIAARQRFRAASQSLAPLLREVATRVCCEDMGLEALEEGLKLPRRSGKLALACALDQLVLHYRSGMDQPEDQQRSAPLKQTTGKKRAPTQ